MKLSICRLSCAAIVATLLAACSSVAPPVAPASRAATPTFTGADESAYRELSVQGNGTVFALDPAASQVRIYAFRGGKAAFAGHDHVISAPAFSGYAYLPAKNMAWARFDLQFRLDQLVVDDPGLRRQTGGAFASTLEAGDVDATRKHMLGPDSLDAAQFPEVTLHSLSIAGEPPRLVATAVLNLHGQTHSLLVPLDAEVENGELQVSGAFALRQSDFGVKPYSVLGGLLTVQDEIAVEFRLVGKPASFGKSD